jgi:hypothetical protein
MPPCPPVIIQLASSYASGIHLAVKNKRLRNRVILPLPPGLLEPHFDRPNIADAAALTGIMKDGMKSLHFSREKAACLIPESCFKIFIFPFESLPASEKERENLIRWRAKKQMPVLPEDVRVSYQVLASVASFPVLTVLARSAVLKEYEDLFAGLGLETGVLTAPMLSLLNLVDWDKDKDLLVANIEEDSMGLMAVTRSEPILYRLKTFTADRRSEPPSAQNAANIIQEIENTVHFIEDREKREIHSLWVRSGLLQDRDKLMAELETGLSLAVRRFEAPPWPGLSPTERAVLAPLVGQIP